jgi:hypothetical protein
MIMYFFILDFLFNPLDPFQLFKYKYRCECFWTGPRPETRIFQASGGFAEPGLKNSCFWTGHRPKTRFSSYRPKHGAAFLFLLQTASDKNNNKL